MLLKFKKNFKEKQKLIFKKSLKANLLYLEQQEEEKKEANNSNNNNNNLQLKSKLPGFNNKNCFYIDFLINEDAKNPKKLKVEIFDFPVNNSNDNIDNNNLFKEIKSKIVSFLNSKDPNNTIFNDYNNGVINFGILEFNLKSKLNNFDCKEDSFLLILSEFNDSFEKASLLLTLDNSKINLKDYPYYYVVGRVYYSLDVLSNLKAFDSLKITKCDFLN